MRVQKADEATFFADPIGRYVVYRSFLVWRSSSTLCGMIEWGSPDDSDVSEMMRLTDEMLLKPGLTPKTRAVLDSRHLKMMRPETFLAHVRHLVPRMRDFAANVSCHAVLVSPGIVGGALAGLFSMLGPIAPRQRVFINDSEAGEWLGDEATVVVAQMSLVAAHARSTQSPLRQFHEYLAVHHLDASLAHAAKHLGVSERTLQRKLSDAHTSFREELQVARLDLAHRELAELNNKLEYVARRVGFNSASHFCAWFRKSTGQTAMQFRAALSRVAA